MAADLTHLYALQRRLYHEKTRLALVELNSVEYHLRTIWIKQIEKEIQDEYKHLELNNSIDEVIDNMSNDDLLKELEK